MDSFKEESLKGLISLAVSKEHLDLLLKQAILTPVSQTVKSACKTARRTLKSQRHLTMTDIRSLSRGDEI